MSADRLKENIIKFKRKFHVNQLIRGMLISTLLFGAIWLIVSLLEGYFWFDQPIRLSLFILLIGLLIYFVSFRIVKPLIKIIQINQGISDDEAARHIGQHFPEIQDKLLNYLQLSKNQSSVSSLAFAAIEQKQNELKVFDFKEAIDFKVNRQYFYYLGAFAILVLLVSFVSPGLFTESSSRIVQFNKSFEKPAPFQYQILSDLVTFKGDSYDLKVRLEGSSIPESVFLVDDNQRLRLNKVTNNEFSFSYPSLNKNKRIRLSAAGFESKYYTLQVINRPELREMSVGIDYPSYTGLSDQQLDNTGSFVVPEGSQLTWNILSSDSEKGFFIVNGDSVLMNLTENEFTYQKELISSLKYEISLKNEYSSNKSRIIYDISVIKDESPQIDVTYLPDTISFRSIAFTGNIQDDYGFTALRLYYKRSNEETYRRLNIPFDPKVISQQFFYQWDIDSIDLGENEFLEVYAGVRDNDAVNGFKSSYTQKFFFKMPSEEEVESMISEKSKDSEKKLDAASSKAEEINERLKDLEDRLRNKKELDWQDEKLINDLIEDKEKLREEIEELSQQHQELLESQKEFGKQSQKLQEKSKQLQELIEEVLDEETKKLYDELQKLLQEKSDTDQVLDELSKIRNSEKNMEKELERALELFKRLKLETGLEQTAEKLEKLSEEQDELADVTKAEAALDEVNPETETAENEDSDQSTEEQQGQSSPSETQKKQEEINKEFEKIQKQLDSLKQLNQDLKNPEPLEDFDKEEQDIQNKLDEIPQDLQNQQKQKAGQKMKNAGQKMKNMAGKMQQMQAGMEMTMMQENIDHLRDILDNLIKLSFAQESIIEEIKGVQQIDPRFIELSQEQLQLISNAEVIEDSLLSLASRVAQISNFVTREVGEINRNLDKTMQELRERNKGKAASYQQFAMTSMNNLALLLDDVLQQMQMSMSEAMGNPQKGQGEKQSLPSMSEMQKQLSDQIENLKNSGKSGRQLSEELAKLAAEQAELRRQLQEMQEQLAGQKPGKEGEDEQDGGSEAGDQLSKAIQQMEENEVDLVNKRLTQQLIERQKEILTRMLEAEESMREQKQSPEREGETASQQQRKLPPAIEEYLKAKKEEIELLKTIPLDLNPFYKKEVNDYFRRLSGDEQ